MTSSDDANNKGYIKTTTHNYVSRESFVYGSRNVEMKGKSVISPNVYIRGDFGPVRIGRYCHIGSDSIIRPPPAPTKKPTYTPLTIGSHTRIGSHCIIQALAIGSSCTIGSHAVVSPRAIIKDGVLILPRAVVERDAVIPPFSVVGGCPGRIVGELPESVVVERVEESVEGYNEFVRDYESWE